MPIWYVRNYVLFPFALKIVSEMEHSYIFISQRCFLWMTYVSSLPVFSHWLLSFPYCFIKDVFLNQEKWASCHTSCGWYSLISSFDLCMEFSSFNFFIDLFTNLLLWLLFRSLWLGNPLATLDHKNIYTHFLLAFLWL